MSAALEMIMVLSKLNNLHSFIDRINCYKQAFSNDGNILELISKAINGSWTIRFVKDVFESFENEEDGGWIFEKFTLIFDEFGIGIDLTSKSGIKSGLSIHEKLVQWLQKEGLLLVKNCLEKQIEFSCIRAIRAWGIAIRMFGFSEIQPSGKTNSCVSVFPLAIRSVHLNVAKEAFRSWKVLATVFASDPRWSMLVLSSEKSAKIASRLELILKALKYKQVPEMAREIFDCWWFCCISLESRLSIHFEDVAHGLLRYCVGGTTDYKSTNEEFSIIYQSVSGPLGTNLVSLLNSKLERKAYSHITLKEIPELWSRLLDVLESLIIASPKLHNAKPCVFDNPIVLVDHSVYAMQCIRFCDVKCNRNKIVKFEERITNLFVTLFNNIYNLSPSTDIDRSGQLVLFLAQFIAWAKETTMKFESLKNCISQIKNRNPFSQIEPPHTSYIKQLQEGLEIAEENTSVVVDESVEDKPNEIEEKIEEQSIEDVNKIVSEIIEGLIDSSEKANNLINDESTNLQEQSLLNTPSTVVEGGEEARHKSLKAINKTPARRSFTSKNGGFGSPGILRKRELSSGTSKSVHWSPVLVRSRSKSPESRKLQRLSSGKSASTSLWNGPPLRSLNEEIVEPPSKLSRMEPSHSEQEQVEETCEIDSEETCNGIDGEFHWVTVFGFTPDFLDGVLELFSRHGDIMAHRATKDGNWVHIRYSSPVHARQALSKNVLLFRGKMIGVVPCRERNALTAQKTTVLPKTSANSSNGSCSFLENDMSGVETPTRLVPSTFYKEDISVPSRSCLSFSTQAGIRPLNSSLVSMNASTDSSLVKGKEDSFIGKLCNISNGGENSASTNTD
uniref:Nucleoporin NUP35 n=1 Tax=Meloidogyne floridensis TaxID=298350 RepID=A0A915NES3_9BILA